MTALCRPMHQTVKGSRRRIDEEEYVLLAHQATWQKFKGSHDDHAQNKCPGEVRSKASHLALFPHLIDAGEVSKEIVCSSRSHS